MSRIIKFRTWDKKYKVMRESHNMHGLYLDFDGKIKACGTNEWVFDRFDLMQFTGLLDKNGEEIWEGDIVISQKLGWYGVPIHDEYTDLISFYHTIIEWHPEDLEKIGNIYENPELLEQK